MAEENDAFYVVQKGDVVGVFKSLSDLLAFIGSSTSNSSERVLEVKCRGLTKKDKKYLNSHGLINAANSISAEEIQKLIESTSRTSFTDRPVDHCYWSQLHDLLVKGLNLGGANKMTYHKNTSRAITHVKEHAEYNSYPETKEVFQSTSIAANHHFNYDQYFAQRIASNFCPCILEFDGASKGNPGPAGAGAVLRSWDADGPIFEFREGLGYATSNVAEYRAIILGLKQALKKGFKCIFVYGDSDLVCKQIQGLCRIKSQSLAELCKEARKLKNKFASFQISHIPRELNFKADAQANRAVILRDGEVKENLCFRARECL